MRRHAEARHFLMLERQVGVDHFVGENATAGQELAIFVKILKRLIKRMTDGWDLRVLFGGQIVQVLIRRIAWIDLVLNSIKTRHHHGRKAEVGVAQGIREAALDAAAFVARDIRNADRCRPVTGRVSELYRCFKTGDQTLIRVGTRVGDRIQRTRVLDDAADVVEGEFAEAGVLVASKQVLAVLPD